MIASRLTANGAQYLVQDQDGPGIGRVPAESWENGSVCWPGASAQDGGRP